MGEEAKQPEKAATEEKPTNKEEEKKEEETPPPPPPSQPLVLYVDLHCVGCAKKIERSLLKLRGVEGVQTDTGKNHVTIKGVVDPQAVCTHLKKKTKRIATVLSPLPEPLPQLVSSQVSGLVTVELTVNMHCEACALQLKKKILQMRGVQTVETELSSGKVTVTGTMHAQKLVDYVYRRTKKQARIIPQPDPTPPEEPKPEENKEAEKPFEEPKPELENKPPEEPPIDAGEENRGPENNEEPLKPEDDNTGGDGGGGGENYNIDEDSMKRMMYYYQPVYVIERIPPPQLFSDENPNACCIT